MSIPTQRNSSFTAEYDPTGRQILNQGVAEGVSSPAPQPPSPPPPPPPPSSPPPAPGTSTPNPYAAKFANVTSNVRTVYENLSPGINLSGLEAPIEGEYKWYDNTTPLVIRDSDPAVIKAAGFKSVRLPVRWSNHAAVTADAALEPVFAARVKSIVDSLLAEGLIVNLDPIHHYNEFLGNARHPLETDVDDAVIDDRFHNILKQVTTLFNYVPADKLVIELCNEPHNRFDFPFTLWAGLITSGVAAIRSISNNRIIVIGGVNYSASSSIYGLRLPADANIIATAHPYDPVPFTHSGSTMPAGQVWTATAATQLANALDGIAGWEITTGIPCLLGEIGSYHGIPEASRVLHAQFAVSAMKARWQAYQWWSFGGDYELASLTGLLNTNLANAVVNTVSGSVAGSAADPKIVEPSYTRIFAGIASLTSQVGANVPSLISGATAELLGGLTASQANVNPGYITLGQDGNNAIGIANSVVGWDLNSGQSLVVQMAFKIPADLTTGTSYRLLQSGQWNNSRLEIQLANDDNHRLTAALAVGTNGGDGSQLGWTIKNSFINVYKPGQDIRFTVIIDGGTKTLYLYVGGTQVASQAITAGAGGSFNTINSTDNCFIGAAAAGPTTAQNAVPIQVKCFRWVVYPTGVAPDYSLAGKFAFNPLNYSYTAAPPPPPPPLGQVTALQVTAVTSTTLGLAWVDPNSTVAITDHRIEYRVQGAASYTVFPAGVVAGQTATLTGLTQLTSYDIRVTAIHGTSGAGTPSISITGTTGAAASAVPNVPTLSSTNQAGGPGTFTLNIAAATTGQPATSFQWEYKLATASTWTPAAQNALLSHTFTGLTGARDYNFRVIPINAAGAGAILTVNAFVNPTVAPSKVTGVTALAQTNSSILITWNPNTNVDQAVTKYTIDYREVGTTPFTTATLNLPSTPNDQLNITPLSPAKSYEFYVYAWNTVSNSPSSDLFVTSTVNNAAYTSTNLGIGVNWSDAGDPVATLPRSPQQSFWTITGRTNPPLWLNSRSWIQLVRLPFNWEAIQPTPFGPLDTTEFNNLKSSVTALLGMGKKILVDCHNFGRHNGFVLGSATLPTSALADLWGKLAGDPAWKDNQNVFFNLMNEPAIPLTVKLVESQNLTCIAIRNTGATNPIVASGNFWSGCRNWTLKDPNPTALYNEKGQQAPGYTDDDWAVCTDFSSAEKMHEVYDPGHNLWWDVHQYFDVSNMGGSNTIDSVVSPATLTSWLDRVTTWARTYGQRCILGETGGGDAAAIKTAVDTVRAYIAANADVWGGIIWWPASWRMQYAGATVPPIQNMYREDLQPGFISNQEYWIRGLTPPGGGVTYPTKAQINMLPASNTVADATDPSRANIGGFTISDNPWGVDNSDGTGNLPNGWNVQVGANALTDGSISTRIIWNFPTTTPGKDSGPEITAYPEIWMGDENGAAPQSPDTFFPRSVGSITTCTVDIKYDPTSTTSGEGQLVLDNWYRNPAGTTILECMIVVRPHGGYGVPNSPAAAVAGRTGEATGRNMTNYVGSRVTIGGIAYDICRNPAGYMNAWAMYIFIPATFPDAMSFDIKAINNWLVADGIINASTVMYALANGDEIRPRMTRPSSGDILFNTKVTKS